MTEEKRLQNKNVFERVCRHKREMRSIITLYNRSPKKTEFVMRVKANLMAGAAQIEHDAIKSRVHARGKIPRAVKRLV